MFSEHSVLYHTFIAGASIFFSRGRQTITLVGTTLISSDNFPVDAPTQLKINSGSNFRRLD